ncbi:MAG: tetratricopeptide repeat protein [Candidatus Kapaibacterium sp.]|jgi:Flp pilus assembly protein TadD
MNYKTSKSLSYCRIFMLVFLPVLFMHTPSRAQTLPSISDELKQWGKDIRHVLHTDDTTAQPPDSTAAAVQTSIQQTLDAVLADSANSSTQEKRDTLDMFVTAAVLGRGGKKPVRAAEAYGSAGVVYFLGRYYDEAIYAYARAAQLEPQNSEWLNDLATALLERDKTEWAKTLLVELLKLYPNLDPAMGNLATIEIDQGECPEAMTLLHKAIALSPQTGLYHYLLGKAIECKGDKSAAKDEYKLAWGNGYGGSGHEGEPGNTSVDAQNASGTSTPSGGTPPAGTTTSNTDLNSTEHGGTITPFPPAPDFNNKPIPPEWVGHYEADYVRAKRKRAKKYGQGMSGTTINEDILTCAKKFSMDIDAQGMITGKVTIMYVYLGTAANAMLGMAPAVAIARLGNFMATLKNGYQIREWSFTGRVDQKGVVEITGMPDGKMDFYNVGQWQKIDPWNIFPPPDRSPRTPARMLLATEKKGVPSIYINRDVDFNGDLSLRYQAYIKKTDVPIVCDCKRIEPKKPTCPASQYLKVKSSIGADGKLTVESSRDVQTGDISTTTKGSMGAEAGMLGASGGVDGSGNVSVEGNVGMMVGSTQYNVADGSYQMTIGIGMNTGTALPGPNKISEKIELVYDSACGWGIKGTAGISTMSMGAGVEGAIYFNRGK